MEKNKINKKLLAIIIAIIIILASLVFIISSFSLMKVNEENLEKVENNTSYPQDYSLKEDEIPTNFELENLDKAKMSRIGLKSNPGFI